MLRPARVEDAPAIARLWTDVYVRERLAPRLDPYTAEEVAGLLEDTDGAVVENDEGELIGAVLLARHGSRLATLTNAPAEAQISLLAVDPNARRAGAGRMLLKWCSEQGGRIGVSRIVLWSRPNQESAHRLYVDLGYTRLPDWDPGDGVRLVFELRS